MKKRNTPQQALLAWFQKNMRDLPWRTEGVRDPYSVVVSEIMLQQTQVTTVLRYWDRWFASFPTFAALAKAKESAVLKAWEGMGYYSRARNLQKLAKVVVSEHEGALPQEVDELIKLPGVGKYSARSIASLAFGKVAACVDGNIVRVLSRLQNIRTQYKNSAAAVDAFQPIANNFLNTKYPGEHNEAMMELGATICTKANPQCGICPLNAFCQNAHAEDVESLPKFERTKIVAKEVKRLWACDGKRILLQTGEAATGVLHGIYELPEVFAGAKVAAKPILTRTRNITRYKITEKIYEAKDLTALKAKDKKHLQWIAIKDLNTIPMSGPHAMWIAQLLG